MLCELLLLIAVWSSYVVIGRGFILELFKFRASHLGLFLWVTKDHPEMRSVKFEDCFVCIMKPGTMLEHLTFFLVQSEESMFYKLTHVE
jgi:hypothetical protein